MFGEVIAAVTGLAMTGVPGRLEGYARFRVRGAVYPGIRPVPGACVHGIVYREVSARSLRLLDVFEGDLYRRQPVIVEIGGQRLSAEAWVVRPSRERLLTDRPWEPDPFRRRHLRRYLDRIGRFPARVAARRSLWSPG
jgi:gamma-glutamylcyclotransferase (GGCT)/AIG2-like uncharacterized protein YtfP